MLTVIVGCGRMGSRIANKLSSQGSEVIIIDSDESSFEALTADFSGFQITGDATQLVILTQAKLNNADALLVLTGDDNVNLTVAQIGKYHYGVSYTLARVMDPTRKEIFRVLGIETILPIQLAVENVIDKVNKIEIKIPREKKS